MFNPSVLDRIELRPTSIEKEIFPAIAADQQLHSFDLAGFWMDVGQPKDYISGTCLYLSHLTSQKSPLLADPAQNKWVYGGNVLVDPVSTAGTMSEPLADLIRPPRSTLPLLSVLTLLLALALRSARASVSSAVSSWRTPTSATTPGSRAPSLDGTAPSAAG